MDENNSLKNENTLKDQDYALSVNDLQRKYDNLRDESEKKLANTIKMFNDKINDMEKMAYNKQQLLESKNADQAQQINAL
jgi:hypothetical protein